MARKRITLDAQQIEAVKRAASLGLRVDDIAHILGISARAFDDIKSRDASVEEAYQAGRLNAHMEVARTLYRKAVEGDVVCMIFYLKAQAGWSDQPKQEAPVSTSNVTFYLPEQN